MSDYIDRQSEIDALHTWFRDGFDEDKWWNSTHVLAAIKVVPAADVVPVVHGKWIDEDPAFAEYFANCSVCGYEIDVRYERGYFNFCPNCGADMRGEQDG